MTGCDSFAFLTNDEFNAMIPSVRSLIICCSVSRGRSPVEKKEGKKDTEGPVLVVLPQTGVRIALHTSTLSIDIAILSRGLTKPTMLAPFYPVTFIFLSRHV